MTPEEHQMIIFVLARQRAHIATIWEVLKSRGVAELDDIPAFENAISLADIGKAEHFRISLADYWKAAKACHVELPPEIEAIGRAAAEWNG